MSEFYLRVHDEVSHVVIHQVRRQLLHHCKMRSSVASAWQRQPSSRLPRLTGLLLYSS
jgi:hypothetical protein